jgi:two-component system invasion response regulator UvrY
VRILIVDDHPMVRRGMRELLQSEHMISVIGEAETPEAALEEIRQHHWDVVLLDLQMSGHDGLELLTTMRTERPAMPILVVSAHPEDQYAVRVLRAGASGYVTKEAAPDVLIHAIKRVAAGGRYISETVAEHLARETHDAGTRLHTLSDREYQVLTLIGQGKTVTEIAERLSLSVKTVSTYRTRLLEKLSLRNTAELIRYAIDHHLLE